MQFLYEIRMPVTQVIREPRTTEEMRAYVALLACTMQALKAAESERDADWPEEAEGNSAEGDGESSTTWRKLPGTQQWDFATGSIGNTVNHDLINILGSRTLTALRASGAPRVHDSGG